MNRKNNLSWRLCDQSTKQAFMELLTETAPERITVSAVCARAGVNRSTFYAHYLDLENMIFEIKTSLHKNCWRCTKTPLRQRRSAGSHCCLFSDSSGNTGCFTGWPCVP